MTIRSRIGDWLFRALFPAQAALIETAEDELVDAALAHARTRQALDDAKQALAETRSLLETTRTLVARLTGPWV